MDQEYKGVKFKTEFSAKDFLFDFDSMKRLIMWCTLFNDYKLAPPYDGGSYGNLSYRVKDSDSFVITGSRIGLKDSLDYQSFVKVNSCDMEKGIVYAEGLREPSSESMLHSAIYQKRKDVDAVFHGHCKRMLEYADALKIPQTEREEPYGSRELVESVVKIIDGSDFIMMKNHGFISLGRSQNVAGLAAIYFLEKCNELP